jgi:hypothetical protein
LDLQKNQAELSSKTEKLVANISNQDLMVMNESEKEALELFRNPPKTHLFS